MRHFYLILFLCFYSSFAKLNAEELVWQLRVNYGSDKYDLYLLSEKPAISFDGESAYFKTEKVETSYLFESLGELTLEQIVDPTAIERIEEGARVFQILTPETILYKGGNKDSKVYVFTISGGKVNADIDYSFNEIIISLKGLPSGYYIVNIDGQTIKIKK